ncbi:MAG: hypothetical protein KDJ52_30145 [Anaerolineae bacterium]|nr:hypothetical protein [Anaerolineae bacterium]
MLKPIDFFDLTSFKHAELFQNLEYVWEGLHSLNAYLGRIFEDQRLSIEGEVASSARLIGDNIVIGPGTVVEEGACIFGPTYIGRNCHIRHGAYIRGQVIMGDGCILGHASEIKHSIMLNDAGAPHFSYVGDSILGAGVNLGAGTKLSNLTLVSEKDSLTGKRPTLQITVDGVTYDTGLTKMGAIMGDNAQSGCNAVLNPGCLVAPRTLVYSNVSLRKGYYPPDSIVKLRQSVEVVSRQ